MGLLYGVGQLRSRIVVSVCALGVCVASLLALPATSRAGVPDPALSTVPNVIAVPGGSLNYSVTIVGTSGPIDSANVTLVYSTAADTVLCWCTGQTHPSITATTNASGIATFNIKAGGCANPAVLPGGIAVEVFVNSVKLKEVGQVSPDIVNTRVAPCTVSLSDAVQFTFPLATATYGYCFDLNSDLAVGLTDAVIATPAFANALTCN